MYIPGRGAFGLQHVYRAAKNITSKEPSARSLQDHWETAADCFDMQAQGDDSSVAPQTHATPKAVGMSDAIRPPACQLEGKH